jgi:hypothetical protein
LTATQPAALSHVGIVPQSSVPVHFEDSDPDCGTVVQPFGQLVASKAEH